MLLAASKPDSTQAISPGFSRKFLKIVPEYSQEVRLLYYKSLGIKFDKVLDIGAYIGTWKDMFKKIFPESNILMIEANKEKEKILKKKVNI